MSSSQLYCFTCGNLCVKGKTTLTKSADGSKQFYPDGSVFEMSDGSFVYVFCELHKP